MNAPGLVVVLTGPSGVGKSSVIKALLDREPGLSFSVSHTTRPRRSQEREGVDYHFVTPEAFEDLRRTAGFLESANVHGHLYGTSWDEVDSASRKGTEILLDIDVQGAAQVSARLPEAVSVFLLPPDYGTLEARLRGRKSEDEASIARRLRTASEEVRRYGRFGYLVINDDLAATTDRIAGILAAERLKTHRRREAAERVLATFPRLQEDSDGPTGEGDAGGKLPGGTP